MLPHMVEKLSPAPLENQLVFIAQRMIFRHLRSDLGQAYDAMGEIRREARHRAIQRIACAGVGSRGKRSNARERGLAGGLKTLQMLRDAQLPLARYTRYTRYVRYVSYPGYSQSTLSLPSNHASTCGATCASILPRLIFMVGVRQPFSIDQGSLAMTSIFICS